MGNTNIPQFGAANTKNSRDTRSGSDQLTDEQKKQRDDARRQGDAGPAPGRPANAPERIPGQQRNPHDAEDVEGVTEDEEEHDRDVERPAKNDLRSPGDAADVAGSAAISGHADTGHSSSDAT
ncbi:hypothetical protein ACPPVV_06295 [Rhodanobacter sp. Col0626]|uniref:hypothetical protein n=1 Tax=Rhodanobacter sp. Col0626 TaxID=3415679 RepID=UPI003CF5E7A5